MQLYCRLLFYIHSNYLDIYTTCTLHNTYVVYFVDKGNHNNYNAIKL